MYVSQLCNTCMVNIIACSLGTCQHWFDNVSDKRVTQEKGSVQPGQANPLGTASEGNGDVFVGSADSLE